MHAYIDAGTEYAALYTNASFLLSDLVSKGLPDQVPVNVDLVAAYLGIRVDYDLTLEKDDIVGQILFEGSQPIIKINPFQNSYNPRRRFTLAHEIGHYCLHSSVTKTGFTDSRKSMSRTDSYWDRFESEANTFAAELLMPEHLILTLSDIVLSDNEGSMSASHFIDAMACKFDVSPKAMEYRLVNIGILHD